MVLESKMESMFSGELVASGSVMSGPSYFDRKAHEIESLLSQPIVNLWDLRELALSEGGLLNDSIRQRAWPALVGLHTLASKDCSFDEVVVESSATSVSGDRSDIQQVELDVTRCTWHLLTGTQRVRRLQMANKRNKKIARVIRKKQRRLATFIDKTLEASHGSSGRLHYYQGYHDVACIFLASLREAAPPKTWLLSSSNPRFEPFASLDLASAVLLQVSRSHFMDCMNESFQQLQATLIVTIFPLLDLLDPEIHNHLKASDIPPFFALPWLITWFAHDIRDTNFVKRIFDAFIASHPALPLYVCVAMLLHPYNRSLILHTECEFSEIHHILASLPKNSSSFGWKYQPGTGYVSDMDFNDDGGSAATNTTNGPDENDYYDDELVPDRARVDAGEGEMVLLQAGILDETTRDQQHQFDMVDTISVTSTMSTAQITTADDGPKPKVPFQELLDMAIRLMHQVPPRCLELLGRKYHGSSYVKELLGSGPRPVLLQSRTAWWASSPTAPAEWWLRSKVRQSKGLPSPGPRSKVQQPIHLRRRKHISSALTDQGSRDGNNNNHNSILLSSSSKNSAFVEFESQQQHIKILRQLMGRGLRAPVASGMVLSVQEEKRKQNRGPIMIILGPILVIFFLARLMALRTPLLMPNQGQEVCFATLENYILFSLNYPAEATSSS